MLLGLWLWSARPGLGSLSCSMPAMVNLLSDRSKSTRDVTESSTDMILLFEALRLFAGLLMLVGVPAEASMALVAVAFAAFEFLVELSCCPLLGWIIDFSPTASSLLFSLPVVFDSRPDKAC